MSKHYDQLLSDALDLFPSRIKLVRARVAERYSVEKRTVRLDKSEMNLAALESATAAVQMNMAGALLAVYENPDLLKTRIEVVPGTLGKAVEQSVTQVIREDMEDRVQEEYRALYEGLGRDDLIAVCKEAIVAAGRARANRQGFDTSEFEQRVAELEDNSHPYAIIRLNGTLERMSHELRERGEPEVARRLWELTYYAVTNKDQFAPDAPAPAP